MMDYEKHNEAPYKSFSKKLSTVTLSNITFSLLTVGASHSTISTSDDIYGLRKKVDYNLTSLAATTEAYTNTPIYK